MLFIQIKALYNVQENAILSHHTKAFLRFQILANIS